MIAFYKAGGIFMHPILGFGVAGLVLCFVQWKNKSAPMMPLIVGVTIATMLLSLIAATVGYIHLSSFVEGAKVEKTALWFLAKSSIALHPIVLAFSLAFLNTLACSWVEYGKRKLETA